MSTNAPFLPSDPTDRLRLAIGALLLIAFVLIATGSPWNSPGWIRVLAIAAAVSICVAATAFALKRSNVDGTVPITISVAALLLSSSLSVYATAQSINSSREAIRASADLSTRDKKLATYVDFLAATRHAFNVVPELSRLYRLNEVGLPHPTTVLGQAPPPEIMKIVAEAATTQEGKYWLINAYDESESAHRVAWELFTYVSCLNQALIGWQRNVEEESPDRTDYGPAAHLTILEYFVRRSGFVPRFPINEHFRCEADLAPDPRAPLYGAPIETAAPGRTPAEVIAVFERELRKVAGVQE